MNRDVSDAEITLARLAALDYMLKGAGFFYVRPLDDGRVIYLALASDFRTGLVRFDVVRLGIARNAAIKAYYAYWDYPVADDAVLAYRAALGWDGDGEPIAGWTAHAPERKGN